MLRIFETGEEAVGYKPSHRVVLIILGVGFVAISISGCGLISDADEKFYFLFVGMK